MGKWTIQYCMETTEGTAAIDQRQKLSREDWIAAAFHQLAKQGIDGVKVDVLARQMGISRGSFYWHFKNRRDLLEALLSAWEEEATDAYIRRLDAEHADSGEKLIELFLADEPADLSIDIEFAIRQWGRRDNWAAGRICQVDGKRLNYVTGLLCDLGYGADDAATRALSIYSLEAGAATIRLEGDTAEWRSRFRACLEIILR